MDKTLEPRVPSKCLASKNFILRKGSQGLRIASLTSYIILRIEDCERHKLYYSQDVRNRVNAHALSPISWRLL